MHPHPWPMGRMNRRDFLRRSAGAAVALPGAAAILAACTKPGQTSRTSIEERLLANPARPDHPVTLPLYQDPISPSTPIEKGATLQIYNWADYWSEFQNPFYDQQWRYTVPYTVYTTGIAYRRDHIPDSKIQSMSNPYEILWDPEYKGRVTIYDDRRETMSMALMKNGIKDVNTGDPKLIDMAKDDVLKLIDATNAQRTINGVYVKMAEDVYWVGSSWSGDVVAAAIYYLPKGVSPDVLGFWYPSDGGGVIGNDLMVIPSSANSPRLAHEFVNFMLDKTNSFANFENWNGYQTPMNSINPSALVPKVIPPSLEEAVVVPKFFDTGSFILGVSPSVDALYSQAWSESKSGGHRTSDRRSPSTAPCGGWRRRAHARRPV